MKNLARVVLNLVWRPLVLVGLLPFFVGVAFAQTTEPLGAFSFLHDPATFALAVAAISGWLVEMITDALKDRHFELRGWQTRLVAAAVATGLAGGGGYFGLSYFTDLSGWAGASAAAGMALSAWLFADLKHSAGQLRKTGQRYEGRTQEALTDTLGETLIDPLLTRLLAEASKLPVPFNLAASAVTMLYEAAGPDAVIKLIQRQRALSEAEIAKNQDGWEAEQATPKENVSVRPATS